MGAKKARFKRSEISVTPWKRLHKGSNCCFQRSRYLPNTRAKFCPAFI